MVLHLILKMLAVIRLRVMLCRYVPACDGRPAFQIYRKCYLSLSNSAVIRNMDFSQKAPLVILLGWGNGKLKNLLHYSRVFEDRGCTTVTIRTSLAQLYLRPIGMASKKADHVVDVIRQLTSAYSRRPVFLMTFSESGTAVYYILIKNSLLINYNICGTIFDSAPMIPDVGSSGDASKAAVAALKINLPVARKFVELISKVLIKFHQRFNADFFNFYPTLVQNRIHSPQLFLFSTEDKVADYQDILTFMDARKLLGVPVISKCWQDSEHVAHYQKHQQEYKETVHKFMDTCLNRHKN